jgi:hypothetical protein
MLTSNGIKARVVLFLSLIPNFNSNLDTAMVANCVQFTEKVTILVRIKSDASALHFSPSLALIGTIVLNSGQ